VLSKSKDVALRFGGEVMVEAIAIGECMRFMFCLIQVMTVHWKWLGERKQLEEAYHSDCS
jgi:hypothetical protein